MFSGHLDYFPGVKQPGSEADRSPECRTEAKLELRCTSAPYVFFHDVKKDNFACNLCCDMFRARSDAGLDDLSSKTI